MSIDNLLSCWAVFTYFSTGIQSVPIFLVKHVERFSLVFCLIFLDLVIFLISTQDIKILCHLYIICLLPIRRSFLKHTFKISVSNNINSTRKNKMQEQFKKLSVTFPFSY